MIDQLIKSFPTLPFKQNHILAPYTFMKVGGPATLFVEVESKQNLFELCSYCFQHNIRFVVIGGVSNSIIPDEGIDALVIKNDCTQIEFLEEHGEKIYVQADSGVVTATLAHATIQHGLTGLEPFIGVPGTLGGAVVNNSHFTAHDLIGNFIISVQVCTTSGELEVWSKEELEFGYDHSIFHHNKAVVLSATFELFKGDPVHMQEKVREAARKRTTTQPIGMPSTGCMYRNPQVPVEKYEQLHNHFDIPSGAVKDVEGKKQIAAGFLIDKAGLKGTTVGGAQVSEKHATYIINTGSATTQNIERLCQIVESKVKDTFGIELEREVFFLQ